MSARYFFDTNILYYCLDAVERDKAVRARRTLKLALVQNAAVVSFQVVQEFFSVAFRKFEPAMTVEQAKDVLQNFQLELHIVPWSPGLLTKAFELRERYGFNWYDTLIIAAALEASCDTLYTEDLQHGQKIETLTVVNPFV